MSEPEELEQLYREFLVYMKKDRGYQGVGVTKHGLLCWYQFLRSLKELSKYSKVR